MVELAGAITKQSETILQLDKLDSAIKTLTDRVTVLGDRLQEVRTSKPQVSKESEAPKDVQLCALAESVKQKTKCITLVTHTINIILEELEI